MQMQQLSGTNQACTGRGQASQTWMSDGCITGNRHTANWPTQHSPSTMMWHWLAWRGCKRGFKQATDMAMCPFECLCMNLQSPCRLARKWALAAVWCRQCSRRYIGADQRGSWILYLTGCTQRKTKGLTINSVASYHREDVFFL